MRNLGDAPRVNQLLARLPRDVYQRILPDLEAVYYASTDVLYESRARINYAYFTASAVISLLETLANGASLQIATIGREGMIGVSLFLGGDTVSNHAVVQSEGDAYRMRAEALQHEFARCGTFQRLLLRYTQALIAQVSQTAVCNRFHTVDRQLCRWLLSSHDRQQSGELIMTHEVIANMLGVRREGVAQAARRLQDIGLIQYARGHIRIIDRLGLENATCECYAAVRDEQRRLLAAQLP